MKFLLLLFLVSSCASSPTQEKLRGHLYSGDLKSALLDLDKSAIAKKERNRFLYLLEKGRFLFLDEDYQQALVFWNEAREKLKGYYKKKVADKIRTRILNNNYQDFQGEIFEQSFLFYSISQAYLRLANQAKTGSATRVQHLASARAAVVDWDSFLDSLERNGIRKFYSESFFARLYGGLIHEVVGSREDLQIAYQLYQDAEKIRLKSEKAYKKILGKRASQTLGKGLVRVSQKLNRKAETKKWEKQYSLKAKEIELNPTIILIEQGLIAAKRAELVPFGLGYAFSHPQLSGRSGFLNMSLGILDDFSWRVLTLNPYDQYHFNYPYIHFHYGMRGSAIRFEMPIRENARPTNDQLKLKLGGTPIDSDHLFSLSELSRHSLAVDFDDIYIKTGLRVASKYLMAIIGSYRLYHSMLNREDRRRDDQRSARRGGQPWNFGGGARASANTSYALSALTIRNSERADTRHWSSLADSIYLGEFKGDDKKQVLEYGTQILGEIQGSSQGMNLFSFSLQQ